MMDDAWILLLAPFVLALLYFGVLRPPPPQSEDLQAEERDDIRHL